MTSELATRLRAFVTAILLFLCCGWICEQYVWRAGNNALTSVPFFPPVSASRRPAGFSPHLGWCHVTERPWSPNASISSDPGPVPTTHRRWAPLPALFLSAELWTRPPHDSPSGTIDKVSQELLLFKYPIIPSNIEAGVWNYRIIVWMCLDALKCVYWGGKNGFKLKSKQALLVITGVLCFTLC